MIAKEGILIILKFVIPQYFAKFAIIKSKHTLSRY